MARRVFASLVLVAMLLSLASVARAADHAADAKLDGVLRLRADRPAGTSQVIVRTRDGRPATLRIRAGMEL